MKTIDEKIRDRILLYEMNELEANRSEIDFRAGVNFAQSWIDFEKELPKIGVDILLKSKNGNTSTYIPKNSDGIKWCSEKFILWRPVERL